jgi:hypothetical protein
MLAIVLAVALTSPPAASPSPRLVGLWESVSTSRGGIGRTLELRADGTCVEATTVIVDLHYRVIGDRLVTADTPPAADADTSKATRIAIAGDVLTQTGADGVEVRKERLGAPADGKPAIVGAWRYRHYTKAIAFERYSDDGRMSFRLPLASSLGRWLLTGDRLALTDPRGGTTTFVVRGDELDSAESGPAKPAFRRVPAGVWYDSEHIDVQR